MPLLDKSPLPFQSRKTFKIEGLPQMTLDEFDSEVKALAENRQWEFQLGLATDVYAGRKIWIGTVSCQSQEIKKKMMESFRGNKKKKKSWREITVSDLFPDLTVLHTPLETEYPVPTANVCVVHGLDGNSIDTFCYDPNPKDFSLPTLWPRDLLPKCHDFRAARIMTYGYNSNLFDSFDQSTMRDWFKNLLGELNRLAAHDEDSGIPLIILGYSLGGLVVREALAQLLKFPDDYKIFKAQCGAVFLGTPHFGSRSADWNKFGLAIGDILGLRRDLVSILKTYNSVSLESQEAWLKKRHSNEMPFLCYCEARESKAGPKHQMIVEHTSAGFLGVDAITLSGTDHHSICKFQMDKNLDKMASNMHSMINDIRKVVAQLDVKSAGSRRQAVSGDPLGVTPYTPIKPIKFGIGGGRSQEDFFGRAKEFQQLKSWLAEDLREPAKPILITGMGGIGKTELTLQIARDSAKTKDAEDGRHVFFLRTTNLHKIYQDLALIIGFEILLVSQGPEHLDRTWKAKTDIEKGQSFQFWLEQSDTPKIIFIDDADILSENSFQEVSEPQKARSLILSTRNPYLLQQSRPRSLYLQSMQTTEVIKAMKAGFDNSLFDGENLTYSDEELEKIGNHLGNHPLGIQHAIGIISKDLINDPTMTPTQNFLDAFSTADHEFRLEFLTTKYLQNRSILDCFELSVERLQSKDRLLLSLVNFAGFLTTKAPDGDFRQFFFWIGKELPFWEDLKGELTDFDLLSLSSTRKGRLQLSKYITSLSAVSLATPSDVLDERREIHSLWAECIQQLAKEEGRLRYIRQIFLICDTILDRTALKKQDDVKVKLLPYITACKNVLQNFSMSFDQVRTKLHDSGLTLEDYMFIWSSRNE